MSSELTPAELRFVKALCTAGPLGLSVTGLATALGLSKTTVGNVSLAVERKGFCSRERFWHAGLPPHPTRRSHGTYVAIEATSAGQTKVSTRQFTDPRASRRAPG